MKNIRRRRREGPLVVKMIYGRGRVQKDSKKGGAFDERGGKK